MPNELTIQAIAAVPNAGDSHAEARTDPFPLTQGAAAMAQPYVNPNLHLDPALGLVVIEFRDESGRLTSTIPSQRQIEAYRAHAQAPPGTAPPQGAAEADEASPTTGPPALSAADAMRLPAAPSPQAAAAGGSAQPGTAANGLGERRPTTDVTLVAALASAVTPPAQPAVREEPIRPEPTHAEPVAAPAPSDRSPAKSDTPSHGA
jgi:hypothetical protein